VTITLLNNFITTTATTIDPSARAPTTSVVTIEKNLVEIKSTVVKGYYIFVVTRKGDKHQLLQSRPILNSFDKNWRFCMHPELIGQTHSRLIPLFL